MLNSKYVLLFFFEEFVFFLFFIYFCIKLLKIFKRMKNLKFYLVFFIAVLAGLVSLFGCSSDDDGLCDSGEIKTDSIKFPIIMDENHDSVTFWVDGKEITITYGRHGRDTRAIDDGKVYPRDPNATLASVPKLVSKGEYKKYIQGKFPPFADLAGVSVVMLRLNKFTFQCVAPANAKPTSIDLTNITPQGFATESANYRGYSIDKTLVTTSGVILNCSFYIQDGIAYGIGGQQLTSGAYYPLPGEQVRYQFTYELR